MEFDKPKHSFISLTLFSRLKVFIWTMWKFTSTLLYYPPVFSAVCKKVVIPTKLSSLIEKKGRILLLKWDLNGYISFVCSSYSFNRFSHLNDSHFAWNDNPITNLVFEWKTNNAVANERKKGQIPYKTSIKSQKGNERTGKRKPKEFSP